MFRQLRLRLFLPYLRTAVRLRVRHDKLELSGYHLLYEHAVALPHRESSSDPIHRRILFGLMKLFFSSRNRNCTLVLWFVVGSSDHQVQVRVQMESRHCSLHPVRSVSVSLHSSQLTDACRSSPRLTSIRNHRVLGVGLMMHARFVQGDNTGELVMTQILQGCGGGIAAVASQTAAQGSVPHQGAFPSSLVAI